MKKRQIPKMMAGLKKKRELDRRSSDLEYWFLAKNNHSPTPPIADSRQQNLTALLSDGPLSLTFILKKLNVYHPLQLNADDLIRRGIIEQATITPTDLLHVTGQMDSWCTAAARQAMEYACKLFSLDPESFAEKTLDLVIAGMVQEAIIFLGRQKDKNQLPGHIEDPWGRWLVKEAIAGTSPYLAVTLTSRLPVIGIGAPAEIFVKSIADILQAPFVLPDYAPVANAVGAVAGSVIVNKEAIVYARERKGSRAYVVQIEENNADFLEAEDAVAFAEQTVVTLAREGAVAAGAVDPQVMLEKNTEGHLHRIVARSIGNPKL